MARWYLTDPGDTGKCLFQVFILPGSELSWRGVLLAWGDSVSTTRSIYALATLHPGHRGW